MPFSIFKNPFSEAKKRKTDDAELVGELLGPEEEAEMREAMGGGPESHRERDDSIRLSEEEEAAKKKVEEEVSPEQRRKEYVEWAMELGESDEWVGETFTFNDDGSVEVEGDLVLVGSEVTRFPKGLNSIGGIVRLVACINLTSLEGLPKSIGGYLYLNGCTGITSLEHLPPSIGGNLDLTDCIGITSLEHLPSSIGGNLTLSYCTGITSLEHLSSSIGGNLNLRGCMQIKDIPKGLKIKGKILLDEGQTELIASAKAKGYKVDVRY